MVPRDTKLVLRGVERSLLESVRREKGRLLGAREARVNCVRLRVQELRVEAGEEPWWRRPELLSASLEALSEAGLWYGFDSLSFTGGAPVAVASLEHVVELVAARGRGLCTLRSSQHPETHLILRLFKGWLGLGLTMDLNGWPPPPGWVDSFRVFLKRVYEETSEQAAFGRQVGLVIKGVGQPRPRPPWRCPRWLNDAAVLAADGRFHRTHPLGSEPEFEAFRTAPLPEGADREEIGHLVIVRFVRSLEDRELVTRALTTGAVWLGRALQLPRNPRYNELGDLEVPAPPHSEGSSLTFYEPDFAIGYKATVVDEDGEAYEPLLRDLSRWLKEGKSPEGQPLEELWVVRSNRSSAVRFESRARALGLSGALYVDDDMTLRNPCPPGSWHGPGPGGATDSPRG